MHSSRMHTICCSGHLSCHTCPMPNMSPTMYTTLPCMSPAKHTPCHTCPLPCMPSTPTTYATCHACPPPHMPPSVDRILDTCLWKHYLSATTVADGKNYLCKWPGFVKCSTFLPEDQQNILNWHSVSVKGYITIWEQMKLVVPSQKVMKPNEE